MTPPGSPREATPAPSAAASAAASAAPSVASGPPLVFRADPRLVTTFAALPAGADEVRALFRC